MIIDWQRIAQKQAVDSLPFEKVDSAGSQQGEQSATPALLAAEYDHSSLQSQKDFVIHLETIQHLATYQFPE